ncbi:uncharacterized protein BXZ73DRAFT_103149 [Epithele typhae]|uniref:uncharacterized protein n=1 Tax=Epithele typhae TaxID=378194 RepID=UPI00200836C2|nr:uncharacterized protein BXZ73DRAFT_103149 [Epithele typhae]KAH9925610.1 hypothetical protein BXZ73DRAFT_103149 [Epithele typhae]
MSACFEKSIAWRNSVSSTESDEVDIGQHCAVTGLNRSRETVLQRAYLVPPDISRERLDKLEFSWGVARHSFDVHDPKNIISLEASLCALFGTDDNEPTGWFLVPAEAKGDINDCYDGATVFKYLLVAFPSMRECSSVIKYSPSKEHLNEDTQRFHYPFIDFGPIYLPVPYHHVVFHTGTKLQRVYPNRIESLEYFDPYTPVSTILKTICNIEDIYQEWDGAMPPTEWTPRSRRHDEQNDARKAAAPCQDNVTPTGSIYYPLELDDTKGRHWNPWTDDDIEVRSKSDVDFGDLDDRTAEDLE